MSKYTYETENRSTEENTKTKKMAGVICSVVFSLVLVCFLTLLNSVFLFKLTCNDLINGSGILKNVDLKSIPIGEFVSSLNLEGVNIDEKTELADIVYDALQGTGISVASKEQVGAMLDAIDAESLLDSVKNEYLKVFLGEEKTASIKTEQIMSFIEANREVIGKTLATKFTDMDIAKIRYYLEMNHIEEQTTLRLPEEYLEVVEIVRLFIGNTNTLTVILGVGLAVFLLLLLVCNWKRKYGVFFYGGLGFILPGTAGLWISRMLGSLLSQVLNIKSTIIDMVLGGIREIIDKNAYLFLYIGSGFIVAFIIAAVVVAVRRKNKVQ